MARRILELAELRRGMRRERIFRDRRNPIDIFDDAACKEVSVLKRGDNEDN